MTATESTAPEGDAARAPQAARSGVESGAADAVGVGLGNHRELRCEETPAPLTDAARLRRSQRFERRRVSSAWLIGAAREAAGLDSNGEGVRADSPLWVRPPRVARCSWQVDDIGVHRGSTGRAHFSGTERCASASCCPVCSAVIRHERAQEVRAIYEAVRGIDEPVMWGLFLTLTVRHSKDQSLQETLDTLSLSQ